jgi:HPt (histidine-containing phosphotransfer) domain-containing protein
LLISTTNKNFGLMQIDLSYLREMSGGNKSLILEMITIFASQVKEFGEDMDRLYTSNQYQDLGKLAHKAKSSVSIMGLNELAKNLKDLENSAGEGKNTETYPVIINRFKTITANAVKELEVVAQNLELYF